MSAAKPRSAKTDHHSLPVLQERVLPTLNVDGTRRWIRPKLFPGQYHRIRLVVAWALIFFFAALPLIHIDGKPLVLLDIAKRQFILFGSTFLATDGVLLMLLLLASFIGIFWITALFGRVWCGYACPQTVYMEFVFRPLEHWLEGSRGQQIKLDKNGPNARRVLKFAIYGVLSVIVANIFLSYFVGTKTLATWLTESPLEHPTPFFVVVFTSALVFFDFAYFREQMCTVICPYARLQSVLLDQKSLIIGYDSARGEPRGKGRNVGGDCIDCQACVIACPTGIDIRDGLQLECVACAQCVDACDGVMTKLNKPTGLIRYATQRSLAGIKTSIRHRPRMILYPVLLVVLVGWLLFLAGRSTEPDVTVLRGIGAPYVEQGKQIQNQLRIKIHNRSETTQQFHLALANGAHGEFIAPENPVSVAPFQQVTASAFVLSPREDFVRGILPIQIVVSTKDGYEKVLPHKLLGPMQLETGRSP